jgi:hypothetical protein
MSEFRVSLVDDVVPDMSIRRVNDKHKSADSFRCFTDVQQGVLLFDVQQIGELLGIRQTDWTSLDEEREGLRQGISTSNRSFPHEFGQLKARLAKLLAEQIIEEEIGRGVDRLKEIHRGVEQTSRTAIVEDNPTRRLRLRR